MANDESKRSPPRRRDFLGIAIGGTAAAFAATVGYPVARFVEPPARSAGGPIVVGKLEDFPIGTATTVLVHERPVLVIRSAEGEFHALSALCTHLQCVVGYSAERAQIECPCHGGVYSIDGTNIAGPPPRPLEKLFVVVNEGAVIVSSSSS